MKKVVVTGAAGFIGSRVSTLLLESGVEVVGIDNFDPAYDPRIKHWRLGNLYRFPDFHFVSADICRLSHLRSVFNNEAHGADAVINFAGRASVRPSIVVPREYFSINVDGVISLVTAAGEVGIKKFVQASSSSVYSDTRGAHREDENTDLPISPYAASKKSAEVLLHSLSRQYSMDTSVLRFFSVYGPAGRPDMIPLRFTHAIMEDKPVTLFGDGGQRRDFTYVDDIARGVIAALNPVVGYEIINLGGDNPTPVIVLLQALEQRIGKRAQVAFKPANPEEVYETWADASKAWKLWAWKSEVDLTEGIDRLVSWYIDNRSWVSKIDMGMG